MKIDYFTANKHVCFEVEHGGKIIPNADEACKWEAGYFSVIGFGIVEEIVEPGAKIDALNKIMEHYSDRQWKFTRTSGRQNEIVGGPVERITGKQHQT